VDNDPAPADAVTQGQPGDACSLEAKLRFLRAHTAHGPSGAAIECLETHMSWLFFTADRVLKLKKPVRFPFLDFSSLAAREFYCREEVRLNSRLAPGVYLGLAALQASGRGLMLVSEAAPATSGHTVDWLVVMRRLPAPAALQRMIAEGRVALRDIDSLAAVLAEFYRNAPRVKLEPRESLARFQRELVSTREVLLRPQFQLRGAAPVLDRLDASLTAHAALLAQRCTRGTIVDGHGDLRPEHVWLLDPPVVIDCLEFNPILRQVDPFAEIAFLGLECEMAGAPWIGARLFAGVTAALHDHPADALLQLYTAQLALRRARFAMAHLLDPQPRTPQHWPPLAQRYIDHADAALNALNMPVAAQAETSVTAATNRSNP
jgi:uncharacterized protein